MIFVEYSKFNKNPTLELLMNVILTNCNWSAYVISHRSVVQADYSDIAALVLTAALVAVHGYALARKRAYVKTVLLEDGRVFLPAAARADGRRAHPYRSELRFNAVVGKPCRTCRVVNAKHAALICRRAHKPYPKQDYYRCARKRKKAARCQF